MTKKKIKRAQTKVHIKPVTYWTQIIEYINFLLLVKHHSVVITVGDSVGDDFNQLKASFIWIMAVIYHEDRK